jgi:threonine dehydrogenase-like Zn-dependent dehydrogenase
VRGSICGTDIGAYYHGGDDAGIFPEHTFGHEMSAVVYKTTFSHCQSQPVK